jgi:hypothetical protein
VGMAGSSFDGVILLPGGGVGVDEGLQLLGLGQGDEVAGDKELLVQPGGGVADAGFLFVGAEDETDGWLIARGHHLFLPVVEVEVHPVRYAAMRPLI